MKKVPSPLVSLIPLVVLVILLFAIIRTFGSDALTGASQIALLTTTGVCVLIGMAFYRISWKDYELAITNNITGVASAIIILLIIGALSGAWDGEWRCTYPDLLRYTNYPPQLLSGLDVHHLRLGIVDDWQFLDYHSHHWHCPYGHR